MLQMDGADELCPRTGVGSSLAAPLTILSEWPEISISETLLGLFSLLIMTMMIALPKP